MNSSDPRGDAMNDTERQPTTQQAEAYGPGGWPASNPWQTPPPEQHATAPLPRDRRPGWGGTISAAVLAAVLASGATAGAVIALDNDSSAPATIASSSSAEAPAQVPLGKAASWSQVAANVEPSVVSIRVRSQTGAGEGSGVVLDSDGRVLTNNHVVAGAGNGGQLQVALSDGRLFDASVVGTDPTTDLAVIQMSNPPKDLKPAQFGDSSSVQVGQPVMAVGNPLGLADTVTTGIISALNRPVTTQGEGSSPFDQGGEPVVTNAIQTDAAVNPGNSGGPLVDANGRVIGINSSIASTGTSVMGGQPGSIGLGFAIPSNEAQRIAKELVAKGSAQHAFLGVNLRDAIIKVDGQDRQAAGVAEVVGGSPAAQAGLKNGDAVIAVDDEPVVGAESLTAQVRERAPGTKVDLTVARGGSTQQVTVTLQARSS
jgi:putative serine protease PepD